MGYTRNKRIALDENEILGIRYLSLLRCITYKCLKNGDKFQEKLNSLDSGLNSEKDPKEASIKIINSISKLDVNILYRHDKHQNSTSSQDNKTINNENITHVNLDPHAYQKELKIMDWKFKFSAQKMPLQPIRITKKQAEMKFKDEFHLIEPLIEDASQALHTLLEKKLHFISDSLAFKPQCRNKNWNSIVEKIVRINYNSDSVTKIQDLIGLRVVTLFEKDIKTIVSIIEKTFKVIRIYKPNYINDISNNSSTHVIVKVPKKSCYLKTNIDKFDLLAEIQIMTLSQFTFARTSHSLLYKKNNPAKKSIESSLKKISVLLDCVDVEISDAFYADTRNRRET